jgi:hypothetical protein
MIIEAKLWLGVVTDVCLLQIRIKLIEIYKFIKIYKMGQRLLVICDCDWYSVTLAFYTEYEQKLISLSFLDKLMGYTISLFQI